MGQARSAENRRCTPRFAGRSRRRDWEASGLRRDPAASLCPEKRSIAMLTGWRDFDDTFRAWNLLQRRIDHVFDDWVITRPATESGQARRSVRAVWPAINAFETKEAFVYKAQVP